MNIKANIRNLSLINIIKINSTFGKIIAMSIYSLLLVSCSHHSIQPTGDNIKVSRKAPKKACKLIEKVNARNTLSDQVTISQKKNKIQSSKAKFESLLDELKLEAAQKGANFVQITTSSASGDAISGLAFICP